MLGQRTSKLLMSFAKCSKPKMIEMFINSFGDHFTPMVGTLAPNLTTCHVVDNQSS